jgi:membrane-bound lytic murein transglycosylase D
MEAGGQVARGTPFPTPPELEAAVEFWTAIFAEHESDRAVLHDRQYMNITWKLLELPKDDKGELDSKASRKLIRDVLDDTRKRLKRLERDPSPTDDTDRELLRSASSYDPRRLEGAWARLRVQRGVADNFRAGIGRARKNLVQIHEILAAENVPSEIAALPFVESMYNPTARSSAGAAGLWQLMPATARGLGLTVKRGRDDRYDILKATRGAARMLRQNYAILGSWPLAITAYNHGPNGVRRAVKAVGSTDLAYLIEHYEKSTWGFASKNFYAEFLAATRLFAEREEAFAALVRPVDPKKEARSVR